MVEEQMTGAQVAAMDRFKSEMMARVGRDIELRKLALDQACRLADKAVGGFSPESFIEFAEAMHKFLIAAADADRPQP